MQNNFNPGAIQLSQAFTFLQNSLLEGMHIGAVIQSFGPPFLEVGGENLHLFWVLLSYKRWSFIAECCFSSLSLSPTLPLSLPGVLHLD